MTRKHTSRGTRCVRTFVDVCACVCARVGVCLAVPVWEVETRARPSSFSALHHREGRGWGCCGERSTGQGVTSRDATLARRHTCDNQPASLLRLLCTRVCALQNTHTHAHMCVSGLIVGTHRSVQRRCRRSEHLARIQRWAERLHSTERERRLLRRLTQNESRSETPLGAASGTHKKKRHKIGLQRLSFPSHKNVDKIVFGYMEICAHRHTHTHAHAQRPRGGTNKRSPNRLDKLAVAQTHAQAQTQIKARVKLHKRHHCTSSNGCRCWKGNKKTQARDTASQTARE